VKTRRQWRGVQGQTRNSLRQRWELQANRRKLLRISWALGLLQTASARGLVQQEALELRRAVRKDLGLREPAGLRSLE
jgi:hypothetical protein